jgi:hypothetical protein
MQIQRRHRHGAITRSAAGPGAAEAFIIIAIATILITRLYLELTGYPQVGGGDLHIAHALWGGALMMLALLIGWMTLGFGARVTCVVLGGVGFGLFLDEVGKFITKTNDYFYGPAPEIMYILVVLVLVGARVVRDFRPLSPQECLASAALIATDGIARGLAVRRRELGLSLVEHARRGGVDPDDAARVQALLLSADTASDRLYALQVKVLRSIPDFFRSPRWVPVIGWLMVISAFFSVVLAVLGGALGRWYYVEEGVVRELAGWSLASVILLVGAGLTLGMALPAMIALRRTDGVWPLVWLRNAALVSTLLNALVDFATKGFGALANVSVGLFAMAILSYQLDTAARALGRPQDAATAPSGSAS